MKQANLTMLVADSSQGLSKASVKNSSLKDSPIATRGDDFAATFDKQCRKKSGHVDSVHAKREQRHARDKSDVDKQPPQKSERADASTRRETHETREQHEHSSRDSDAARNEDGAEEAVAVDNSAAMEHQTEPNTQADDSKSLNLTPPAQGATEATKLVEDGSSEDAEHDTRRPVTTALNKSSNWTDSGEKLAARQNRLTTQVDTGRYQPGTEQAPVLPAGKPQQDTAFKDTRIAANITKFHDSLMLQSALGQRMESGKEPSADDFLSAIKAAATVSQAAEKDAVPGHLIKQELASDVSLNSIKTLPPLTERMGQGQWQQDLSQRIQLMLNHQIQHAQIQLNPRHLGAMEIQISMGQEQQVNVSFTVQHAHVKDALDSALPRLREMLQEQGFSLNHSDVSQHQQHKQNPDDHLREPGAFVSTNQSNWQDSLETQTLSIAEPVASGLDLFV